MRLSSRLGSLKRSYSLAETDRSSVDAISTAPTHCSVDHMRAPWTPGDHEIGTPDESPSLAPRKERFFKRPLELLRFGRKRRFAGFDKRWFTGGHGFAVGHPWRYFIKLGHCLSFFWPTDPAASRRAPMALMPITHDAQLPFRLAFRSHKASLSTLKHQLCVV